MTSVHSGTKLSKKQGSKGIAALPSQFSERFAIITSLCIKVPMLPQLRFPLPPILSTPFCLSHHRIHCATSLAIALFSPNPLIRPMPRLAILPLAVAPCHGKSTKQPLSHDPLHYLVRQYLAKLNTALRPLHPRYRFTPVYVPQMHHHQVLWRPRCNTPPRPLHCLILRKEIHSGI